MANFENIILEKKNHIAYITLNRPDKLNSLSVGLMTDLDAALVDIGADNNIRVVVIKGAGRAFCTGYDLSPTARQAQLKLSIHQDRTGLNKRIDAWMRIWDLQKFVIAQVHGYAIAGGSMLAAICDLTYVAEDAQIGMPELPIGAALITPFWLPLIGPKRTKEYSVVSGRRMTGKEAAAYGYANAAFPADKLEEEVNKIAKLIAKRPLEILALEKVMVNRAMEMSFRDSVYFGSELDAMARFTEPARDWVGRIAFKGLKQATAEFREIQE